VGLSAGGPLARGVEFLDVSHRPKTFLYRQGAYDHDEAIAPFFGKHRIGVKSLEDLRLNPNYASFRDGLRLRMQHDDALDEVLRREFGDLLADPT